MNIRLSSLTKRLALRGLTIASFSLIGCGRSNVGPTEADLVRRQQLQETAVAIGTKTVEERIENARKFLADENVVAARTELRPLVASDRERPEVILLNAQCEAADGNLLAASRMVDAIEMSDDGFRQKAMFLKANWSMALIDFETAESALREVLEHRQQQADSTGIAQNDADTVRAHRGLARLLNTQGLRISAAPHLGFLAASGEIQEKELIAMISYSDPFIDMSLRQPDFSTLTRLSLALAKKHRFERDLPATLKLIEQLADRYPDSAPILAFQGRVYADLLDEAKLQSWIARLPSGIESEPESWFARGVAAQQQTQHREAVRLFLEAVTLDPTDRSSYMGMSRSLTILGMSEEAQKATERFTMLDETVRLAAKFGREPGSREQLDRMASLLLALQRPAESLAWKLVALKRFAGSDDEIQDLMTQRESLFAKLNPESDDAFLTCGLSRSDWPLLAISSKVESTDPRSDDASGGVDGMPNAVPIRLVNVANSVGIDFQYDNGDDPSDENVLLHQLTGGGIGVIDFELDGWPDLYLTQGGGAAFDDDGSKSNMLLRNQAGKHFVNVTPETSCDDHGYGQGVAVADLNQDGFPDLAVANIGPNRIFINQGDGTFRNLLFDTSESNGRWTTSLAVGDLSGDGLPELVEINYVDDPTALTMPCASTGTRCNPSVFKAATNVMWSMTSEGEVVCSDNLWKDRVQPGYGFAAVIANFDSNAGNDLFIANDTIENFYWLSQSKEGSQSYELVEKAKLYGCAFGILGQRQGCMGVAHGDFDRNGHLDLHVTNFWDQPADLYLQRDNGFFVNASPSLGIDGPSRKTVAWGTQAADFDRNGWLDLAVLNGHVIDHRKLAEPFKMTPQLFRGDMNQFHLMSTDSASDDYWNQPTLGRTLALLDWNRDFKPDLVGNHLDVPTALLENLSETGNALQVEVIGVVSERDAIGAVITVHSGDTRLTQWVAGGDGFLCSNEAVIDFGLGTINTIDSVQVDWPSGKKQTFDDMVPNQRYLVIENESQAFPR